MISVTEILASMGAVGGQDFAAVRGVPGNYSIDWIGSPLFTTAEIDAVIAAYTPTPTPDPTNAYNAIIGSTLFQRIDDLGDSVGNERVGRKKLEFGLSLTASVYIAAATQKALEKLNTAIDEALVVGTHSLTATERAWLENWNATYNLGLTMPWA